MTEKFNSLVKGILLILLAVPFLAACGGKDEPGNEDSGNSEEIKLTLPASVDVVKGSDCILPQEGQQVLTSDFVYLEKDGKIKQCSVTESTSDHFAFKLSTDFQSGSYKFSIKRGDRRVQFGNISINIVSKQVEILPGTTVYGVVESAEGPIAGVVVSDGVITTVTDADGVYQLKSDKELGYVFISVPSGYDPVVNGVFPEHYKRLVSSNKVAENASFTLKKVDQSNYKVLFLGDMHVANRSTNNDLSQFKAVASDIKKYASSLGGKVYGITLGDMSWDLYWYDRNYGLADYARTVNECLGGLPIYHTPGNHDNDMRAFGNSGAKNSFGVNIAPSYYSFNIGQVHYVVLDNVDCKDYIGDESRNHTEGVLYDPQLSWLENDLKYVDKSTPVCVMMHVPVYATTGVNKFSKTMKDADKLLNALAGYTVHYVTGHTHRSYNLVPENSEAEGRNIYEHNLSALCSDWWWSGNLTPGLLQATDGTPSGYGVWTISGKDIKWIYKCAGMDENFQFRSYDMNNIKFTDADVPNLKNSTMLKQWHDIIAAYTGAQNNEVLINAWQQNSRWKVSVKTEKGETLTVKQVSAYDPIQIYANTMKRFNADINSAPIGTAQNRHHFYKVTAPDKETDLVITVEDEFGHKWTENMSRPKAFDEATYKITIK